MSVARSMVRRGQRGRVRIVALTMKKIGEGGTNHHAIQQRHRRGSCRFHEQERIQGAGKMVMC
eukprot:704130-Heterocapsa_arctica.AAC.1